MFKADPPGILDQKLDESDLSPIPLNVIHDEILLEALAEEAQGAAELLRGAMVDGFVQIFPGAEVGDLIEITIENSWGGKQEHIKIVAKYTLSPSALPTSIG